MTRLEQFQETIDLLDKVIARQEVRYCTAESFKQAFEYCSDLERGKENDIKLLKLLCIGIPAKEIEVYDQEIINSIYKSYAEMKLMLREKSENE